MRQWSAKVLCVFRLLDGRMLPYNSHGSRRVIQPRHGFFQHFSGRELPYQPWAHASACFWCPKLGRSFQDAHSANQVISFWRAIFHFARTKPKNQLPNQWFQCKQMQADAVSITCDCPCRVRKERARLLMSNTLVVPLRVRPILWLWTNSLAMVVQPFSLIWTHLI